MTRRGRSSGWRTWLVMAALATGCGPAGAPPDSDDEPNQGQPGLSPELPRYRLRIVNHGAEPLVVHASAGAERVLVDTVAPRDSGQVDLALDADSVVLEALDRRGATLAERILRLHVDSLNRWEIETGLPEPSGGEDRL